MDNNKMEHNLIEHMLMILNTAKDKNINIDFLSENGDAKEAALSLEQANIDSILEMIRFMDEMPGGFLIYHADGNEEIIYANKALLRIFHCNTLAEFRYITGNSFKGLVYREDLSLVENSIAEQISNSQYDLDYVEYRIVRKDGVIRWVEDYGHFIHSQTVGDIFYVFISDATEKRNHHLSEK